jgi:hypothetical protein
MRQSTKKLTDAVAVSRLATEPGCAIRKSCAEGLARILKVRKFRVLLKARKDAQAGISNDKLEGAVTHSIGDEPCFNAAAVRIHIILQLPQCAKQPFNKPTRKITSRSSILGMLGPLIPKRLILGGGVVPGQGEYASNITHPVAGYGALVERLVHHVHKSRFERDSFVSVGKNTPRHREFHQRTNSSGALHANASILGEAFGSGLPKQIVSVFKTAINITRCLHALPANPSTHLFGGQQLVGAPVISANAGSRPVAIG